MRFDHRLKIGLIFLPLLSLASLHSAEADPLRSSVMSIDLAEVFSGSPLIYVTLLLLSVTSLSIWIYSLFTLRLSQLMPTQFLETIKTELEEKHFEKALETCKQNKFFVSKVLYSGILARKHGIDVVMSAMQAEGRRCGNLLWQRISLLNEIAAIAPMIGLLGTVIGLFYAFYNSNSSKTAESLNAIFDGLGMAVGTTVAGLIVAIVAMIFYTLLKFKVTHILNTIECESYALIAIIHEPSKPSTSYQEL